MSDPREERLRGLVSDDPGHRYSEDELDAIEELDADLAYRIARAQALQERAAPAGVEGPIDPAEVAEAVAEARRILMRDGGDIELVGIEGSTVRVRMKGACVGCPRSVLDLRNVVERLVRSRAPAVTAVVNEGIGRTKPQARSE
jgi:toxin CptA